MRGEGGAKEGLINHSCIVIDFLLQGVSQTLNYVFVCVCVCRCLLVVWRTKSSITAPHFLKVWHSSRFNPDPATFLIFPACVKYNSEVSRFCIFGTKDLIINV